jgi:uncharacterized Zn-binding protein involved in type VI secretion
MPQQSRRGDNSRVPEDSHGNDCCPHDCIGPAESGSPDVKVNNRPALRVTDVGIHAKCCGENVWVAKAGSSTVLINGLKAHRKGDLDEHCGGPGFMVEGSEDVITGG